MFEHVLLYYFYELLKGMATVTTAATTTATSARSKQHLRFVFAYVGEYLYNRICKRSSSDQCEICL
jgi:hypothetical protein